MKLEGNADCYIDVDVNGNVLVNGEPVAPPPVKVKDVHTIKVEGGDGDNTIDA